MKRGFFRRFGFVLVLALALGAMTFPASADNLDDNLASKASQACVRFGLENGGEIKRVRHFSRGQVDVSHFP